MKFHFYFYFREQAKPVINTEKDSRSWLYIFILREYFLTLHVQPNIAMNTKLTLNIDQTIIEEAKFYAKTNNVSLSNLIENYLQSLTQKQTEKTKISPLVESLTGVISLENSDYKKEYSDYLSNKYS